MPRKIKVQVVKVWEFEVEAGSLEEATAMVTEHLEQNDYPESSNAIRYGRNKTDKVMSLPDIEVKMYYEK